MLRRGNVSGNGCIVMSCCEGGNIEGNDMVEVYNAVFLFYREPLALPLHG